MSDTLKKEILNISLITLLFGIVQVIITIPAGYFGRSVVFGTLLGCAVAESTGIYGLVVALILLFANPLIGLL